MFGLLQRHGRKATIEEAIAFSGDLLLGSLVPEPLRDQLAARRDSSKDNNAEAAHRIVAAMVTFPEFQVVRTQPIVVDRDIGKAVSKPLGRRQVGGNTFFRSGPRAIRR